MACSWWIEKRHYVAGNYDRKGDMVFSGRKHWKEILESEGVSFVEDLFRRMHDAEIKGRALVLSSVESDRWRRVWDMLTPEGWVRFYFDGLALKCKSLIKIDREHREYGNLTWVKVEKPEKKGPMADTLEGFVHED